MTKKVHPMAAQFKELFSAGLKGMADAALPKCQVKGCKAYSLLGTKMGCSQCGKLTCQAHYFLTPSAPPQPMCVECVVAERRAELKEMDVEAPKTKGQSKTSKTKTAGAAPPPSTPSGAKVVDAEFVDAD